MTTEQFAKINDEMLQDLLKDKGVERPVPHQWNYQATRDAIRHFAEGAGDLNPLWIDAEYARKTRWGGVLAPPLWLLSCSVHHGRMGLPGIHALHAGIDCRFFLPVREGDTIQASSGLKDLEEKRSSRFAGRTFLQIGFINFRNQRGELVATFDNWVIRFERDASGKREKYHDMKPATYTKEQLDEIWRALEAQEVRGATPRFWEDVREGEEMRPLPKGPLVVSDIVGWKMGWGSHNPHHMRANENRYWTLKRHPQAGVLNTFGVSDNPERVHVGEELARRIGIPGFYDYGPQRSAWVSQLVTNWMGDAGWLRRLRTETRLPNIEGDTQWVHGKVVKKWVEGQDHLAQLDLWVVSQRGDVTMPCLAEVVLPARSSAPAAKGLPTKAKEIT
ncbi:MAG: MaoC family dehydratase N-terminal domain-containing protein [Chloroflexota bacterium]